MDMRLHTYTLALAAPEGARQAPLAPHETYGTITFELRYES